MTSSTSPTQPTADAIEADSNAALSDPWIKLDIDAEGLRQSGFVERIIEAVMGSLEIPQHSSDMVERVADCFLQSGELDGEMTNPRTVALLLARTALEACHHAELVELASTVVAHRGRLPFWLVTRASDLLTNIGDRT